MASPELNPQVRRLMVALNRIDGLYYRFAKSSWVKENTLVILYVLSDGLPHSQKQICDEWLIPKTTINTIVREMTDAGHLILIRDEGKKEKTLVLTESGKALAENVLGKCFLAENNALEETLSTCSPEFIDACEQFAANLEKEFTLLK